MEAFLLTPNAPAQKPMQAQNQQNKSKSNTGEFAPLLNETISSQEGSEGSMESITPENSMLTEETISSEAEFASETSDRFETTNSVEDFILDFLSSSMERSPEIPLFIKSEKSIEIPTVIKEEQANFIQEKSAQLPFFTIAAVEEDSPTELQALAPLLQKETGTGSIASSKAETLLLQQIQQLLNEGQNKGPVIIRNTTQQVTAGQEQSEALQKLTSPTLLSARNGEIQTQQTLAAVAADEGKSVESGKSVKLEGNRQDITGQYLSARIGETGNKESNTDGQFQQSGSEQQASGEQNKSGPQSAAGVVGSSLSSMNSGESNPGFLSSLNTASTDQASVEGKFSPGSQAAVPEKEIVNNLIQRFSVNPRLQTSKLSMQLHPAELGELKIDILVKEGSIKANIVAQSQQVLDTLEKNMPRLRTVLEAQGFTVDSFEITMDSDSGRQQELFQQQFSSNQQETSFAGASSKETKSFELVLDNIDELAGTTDNSGVNVTV